MATIKPTVDHPNDDSIRFTWVLAGGNVGEMARGMSNYADRSVQMFGDFGAGSVLVNGSNENSPAPTMAPLNDPFGVPLSFSSAKIREVLEYAESIQPVASAVNSVTVVLLAKRQKE